MMRPDINIAIAYSGEYQTNVAEMLQSKLNAYIDKGYPVSVSLVREKIKDVKVNFGTRQDGENQAIRIAKAMENYFSDFDCAIFLFDTNGEAIPKNGERAPLLSSNLVYEYGLASSYFINREIDASNGAVKSNDYPTNDKRIFCFSPTNITTETLKYIHGIDLIKYDEEFGEHGTDIEKQTDYIINHFIHKLIVLEAGFYGLPETLPTLILRKGKYVLRSQLQIRDLMEQSSNNEHWPDLGKLKPGGVRVALDTDSSALSNAFNEEYKHFEKATNPSSEYVMARRIMYIVDRTVFIMYLREESSWKEKVKVLKTQRENIVRKQGDEFQSDFYWLVLDGLCSIFDYQSHTRLKSLYESNYLENILKSLKPIVDKGCNGGNKMIYCLFADYMALTYHKLAMRVLKDILGHDFYLDNFNHIGILRDFIKSTPDLEKVKSIIIFLEKAIVNFASVVDTSNSVQKIESNGVYIWQSYALYNQARCEFLLHLIDIFATNMDFDSDEILELLDNQRDSLNKWEKHLHDSIISRKDDYTYFKKLPLFPQIIRFNLKAEFYHAEFEYELACLIDQYFNSTNAIKPQDEYDFDHKKQGFREWKEKNLTITDVLSVDGKVSKIDKLKSTIVENDIHNVFDTIVEKLNLSTKKKEELRKSLYDITPTVKKAMLTNDPISLSDAKNEIESVRKSNMNFNINLDIAAVITSLGKAGAFIIKLFSET